MNGIARLLCDERLARYVGLYLHLNSHFTSDEIEDDKICKLCATKPKTSEAAANHRLSHIMFCPVRGMFSVTGDLKSLISRNG